MYETFQVTPATCTCRVGFGGDKHMKSINTGCSACAATETMAKSLCKKFYTQRPLFSGNPIEYEQRAFHLVLNRYRRNDGLDAHQDISHTYDVKHPIASLSFGRGALLVITTPGKAKRGSAVYYQFPNDAIIMSGAFNKHFFMLSHVCRIGRLNSLKREVTYGPCLLMRRLLHCRLWRVKKIYDIM